MHDGTPPAFVESMCYVHTSCITNIQLYADESTLVLFCGGGVKLEHKADAV